MPEVVFSACLSTEVAWESGGNGDFTTRALRVLTNGTRGLSNENFEQRVIAAFGATPRFFPQMVRTEIYSLSDVQITNQNLLIIIVAVVMMFGLHYIVHRTRIGTAMRATSFNLSVAKLMGINTDFVIAFTFALGSALVMPCKFDCPTLVALSIPRIDPLMGLMTGLKAFVAAVLGGIGNIPGAMLGGMLIGLMETGLSATAYSTYRDAVAFGVLILILLVRPAGILGTAGSEKV